MMLRNGHLVKIFTDLKVPTFPPLVTAQNTFLTIKIINNTTTSKHVATCFDLLTKVFGCGRASCWGYLIRRSLYIRS